MKDIEGYEGLYAITEDGKVWSHRTEIWRKGQEDKDGYLRVALWVNGVSKNYPIHRLVAMTFIPNPGNKQHVNHKDGNKSNNSLGNLEWTTPKENIHHGFRIKPVRKPRTEEVEVLSPFGQVFLCARQKDFIELHELHQGNFAAMLRGLYKSSKGWSKYEDRRH